MPYLIEAPDGSPICVVDAFSDVVKSMSGHWMGVIWYDRLDCPIGPEGEPHGTLTAVVWVGSPTPSRAVVGRSRFLKPS